MHIDPNAHIAGLPSRVVRDFLRRSSYFGWNVHYAAARFKTSTRRTARILRELVALGFVDRDARGSTPFHVTLSGSALGLASAARPLHRATAEARLAAFLERVGNVNSDDHYLFAVERVLVFGSYLTKVERLNDVDVAVELVSKIDSPKKRRLLHAARTHEAIQNGRRFGNISQESSWPYDEVILALKGRSRAIGLHTTEDNVLKHAKYRVIFERSGPGDTQDLP